jgi:hypothetical protein
VHLHALGIHGGWTIVCPACHCGLTPFSAAFAILALSPGQSLDSSEEQSDAQHNPVGDLRGDTQTCAIIRNTAGAKRNDGPRRRGAQYPVLRICMRCHVPHKRDRSRAPGLSRCNTGRVSWHENR